MIVCKSCVRKTKNNQAFISQLCCFLFPCLGFECKIPFLNISTSCEGGKNSTCSSQNSQSKENDAGFKSVPCLQKCWTEKAQLRREVMLTLNRKGIKSCWSATCHCPWAQANLNSGFLFLISICQKRWRWIGSIQSSIQN